MTETKVTSRRKSSPVFQKDHTVLFGLEDLPCTHALRVLNRLVAWFLSSSVLNEGVIPLDVLKRTAEDDTMASWNEHFFEFLKCLFHLLLSQYVLIGECLTATTAGRVRSVHQEERNIL